jgi:endo-1,4-beta-xylanase
MPTGGTAHMSANAQGTADGLDWTIWSNGSAGSITTYANAEAFSATWANSGDFLARLGMNWQSNKTYTELGTITAEFAETKTGTGGGYSYIGIYGWSVSPCVEFYIVDDSYNTMPVNPGNTTKNGTAMIDGGTYILYSRPTTGTGGSNCPGVSSWTQFYSVRETSRSCGTISVSQHFAAWAAANMTLGNMNQAQVLVEVGGGSGSINFTTASMTVQSM